MIVLDRPAAAAGSAPVPSKTFDEAVRTSLPRPTVTPRRHPDLTSFLFGFLALLVALFLITVFSEHVQARAAETVAQGIARRAM